jgi:hypothetical protein
MKQKKVVCLHFADSKNVGDMHSCPSLYFNLGARMDVSKAEKANVTIYGGGSMSEVACRHAQSREGTKIGWGIGYTVRGLQGKHQEPDYSMFQLIGVRDFGLNRWVPCPSCMSGLFDEQYLVTKDVVFYGHKLLSPMESLNNDCTDIAKVIEHLASGETVVTSSYHGAYWATLLGRKVIAIPYGSKFYHLKHMPTLVDKFHRQEGKAYPEALAECRDANQKFYADVMALIESEG